MLNPLPQIKTAALLIGLLLSTSYARAQEMIFPNNDCFSMQLPDSWHFKYDKNGSVYKLPNDIIFFGKILFGFRDASAVISNFKEASNAKKETYTQGYDTLDGYVVATITTESEIKSGDLSEKYQVMHYVFDDQVHPYGLTIGAEASKMKDRHSVLDEGFRTLHFKTKEFYTKDFTAHYPVIWHTSRIGDDNAFFHMSIPGADGHEFISFRKIIWPIKSIDDEIKKQVKPIKGADYKDLKITDDTFGGMPAKKVTYVYKNFSISKTYYVKVKDSYFEVSISYAVAEASLFENMMARWEANSFKWN